MDNNLLYTGDKLNLSPRARKSDKNSREDSAFVWICAAVTADFQALYQSISNTADVNTPIEIMTPREEINLVSNFKDKVTSRPEETGRK